ncbi:magnesium transporter NIPA [Halopolyspora algeriensis]|uniref:Magnesium transporter NIPA n=1 Tax=Halopolyspora algeriensis TaxID=1500506 RepID=A0A368VWF2_9ACTN|nr:DMT family transporter [Halopolyspora algeriensis]RCW46179.1 magnesium transporter NIPA [Halopolyspora algeriensis]TQM55582.1 magnesium transporter NIPA [Halopolyspora algeriensis]
MSSGGAWLVVAVPCAVAGAASFGMASVVQQRATKQVPDTRALNPRLLLTLVRKPIWVASVLTVIVGLSLQVVALAFGPLMLVQPLLVTSVLFGVVYSAWMSGRRLDRTIMVGSLSCVAGLSAFLLLARPSGGGDLIERRTVPLALALGLVFLLCMLAASFFPGEIRVIALALATGVLYGVTAALMKVVTSQIRAGGIAEPFQHWVLYAVCVIGPCGFLLSQNAFQQGKLISPALAMITSVDPLVGVAIGVLWFGEYTVSTPAVLAGEVLAGITIIGGIAVLTHRGEHLRRETESAESDDPSGRITWG